MTAAALPVATAPATTAIAMGTASVRPLRVATITMTGLGPIGRLLVADPPLMTIPLLVGVMTISHHMDALLGNMLRSLI